MSSLPRRRAPVAVRKLQIESLEERDLLAVYLPSTFADERSQPHAISYNGGEQLYFNDQTGHLQFGFGQSVPASAYQGSSDWRQVQTANLTYTPPPQPVGRVATFHSGGYDGGRLQAVYRTATNSVILLTCGSWGWQGFSAGASSASNFSTNVYGANERITYVTTGNHVWSIEPQSHFIYFGGNDLNSSFNLQGDPTADALPAAGTINFSLGSERHVVYQRADNQLGVFSSGTSGSPYEILNASTLPGFVPPSNDAQGELSYVSYDYTGQGGLPNVGWIVYHGANGQLRVVWKVAGQPWRTFGITTPIEGIPTAAYDPVAQKLSIAVIDTDGNVQLVQEDPVAWKITDYNAGLRSIPAAQRNLPSATVPVQASGKINFPNTIGFFTITANADGQADGTIGNSTNVTFARAPDITQGSGVLTFNQTAGSIAIGAVASTESDGARGNISVQILPSGNSNTYVADFFGSLLRVRVATGATVDQIAAVIDADGRFTASSLTGGSLATTSFDWKTYSGVTTGGSNGTLAASYDAIANEILVSVSANARVHQICAAVDALADFNASDYFDSGWDFKNTDDGTRIAPLSGGGTGTAPAVAARPSIYWRPYGIGGENPSLHIVYLDASGHIQNLRVGGQAAQLARINGASPILDTTAFLDGYRPDFGFGVVNAARAVAYAMNQPTALSGGSPVAWNLDLIQLPAAWTATTGDNTAVFVLDSGVDPANLDLQTLAGLSTSSNSSVDDVNGHGTAIAGVIAAANDGNGITGVAYDADVVPIKVGDAFAESEPAIVDGIDAALSYALPGGYAATRVIQLGFGYSFDTIYRQAVLTSVRDKIYDQADAAVFVLPAGNRAKGQPDMPGGFGVGLGIVAGAIDASSQRWSAGNGTVDSVAAMNYLLAPGVDVPASALVGSNGNNHNAANVTGTGIAAAHISGVAALLLEVNPNLTPRELESILLASADPVSTTSTVTAPSYPLSIYWA